MYIALAVLGFCNNVLFFTYSYNICIMVCFCVKVVCVVVQMVCAIVCGASAHEHFPCTFKTRQSPGGLVWATCCHLLLFVLFLI